MISACIIVKDEEKNLARCLTSLSGVATELIVVDTGSTDDSSAIARSFGANIFEFAWIADFSAARNFSLSKATKPWALVIDADEQLDVDGGKQLLSKLQTTSADAILLQIQNYLGDPQEPELMIGTSVRLFRTGKGFTYRGLIHEDITTSIVQAGGRIAPSDVKIHHYGYLDQTAQGKSRFERNTDLLRTMLAQDPKDGNVWFYLGTEYFVANRYRQALTYYEQALKLLPRQSPFRPRLLRNLVEALRQTGHVRRASQLVQAAITDYPDYPDLWFLYGLAQKELADADGALASFSKAFRMESSPIYESNVTATREKACLNAAEILFTQGRYGECLQYVTDCIAINPGLLRAYTLAIKSYVSMGELAAAEEVIEIAAAVDPTIGEALSGIGGKIKSLRLRRKTEG